MIKNYIKITLRNIKRQKIYSLITMSGLILGLSAFIMFALMADFTASFDGFHDNADRIYAVVQVLAGGREGEQHSAMTPPPLVPALMREFPEIEKATGFFPPGRMVVKNQDKIFYENGVRFVDADFLSIFTFKMLAGDRESALSGANSIVMTEETAFKYFGDEDPLGRTLALDNEIAAVVTGITENIPANSSIHYDFLVSMETARSRYGWMEDWSTNNQGTLLLLSEGSIPTTLEPKLASFIVKYYPDTYESPRRFYLHSVLDFFLGSEGIDGFWGSGRISYITVWIVAVLLLIIACINFMNISTARYLTRAHEVGMRKVVGASRRQLVLQFLGESTLMALISMPAAILLYELLRPLFAARLGRIFELSALDRPPVLVLIFGVTVLTGLFAGSYPAFTLSAFKPVLVFQRRFETGKKGSPIRRILVIVQFSFSIILILMTVISIKQARHNLNVDLGYDRIDIIAVTLNAGIYTELDILKNELLPHKDIISVSASAALPIEWNADRRVLPEGAIEEEALTMNAYGVDYGLIEMLNIAMALGRSFSPDYSDADGFILNQTAVRQLQWPNPIGKQISMGERKGTVIGVAEDFHFKSILLEKVSPALMYLGSDELNYLLIKYASPESLAGVIAFVGEKWSVIAPDLPFEYVTLEDAFYDVYQGDKTTEMSGALGALAIFLSCLGLFGLSSFSVERRTKEIGIRKVLGASVACIVRMFTEEFIKLVAIANLLALPVAYLMMNAMIQFIYAYPTAIGSGIFLLTAGLTLLIAFLTVSVQTVKAALANPVDSLKYE